MKTLSCCLLLPLLLLSCHHGPASAPPGKPAGKKLVSYSEKYTGGSPDTLLPGGAYVKFLVNADTADKTLYIRYGRPGLEHTHTMEDGINAGSCRDWRFEYSTPHTIALMYECMNSRALMLLPLEGDSVQYVFPLYVSLEDSLMLGRTFSGGSNKPDLLTAADLDYRRKKTFTLSYTPPCSDMLTCFDTIYFNKQLIMRYLGGNGKTDPEERMQTETLPWKQE